MSGGLTLDASALIAFERNDRAVVAIVARAQQHKVRLAAPAGVVGQVWRDGARQTRLARLLGSDSMEIVPLDDERARARSEEHTSELQSQSNLVCRLLLEKKKKRVS